MGTTPERRAKRAAYMREWRLRDLEATREKERARTLRRLGPLPPTRPCRWCGTHYTPRKRTETSWFCSTRCKDLARSRARQDAIDATKAARRCMWCDADIPRTMRADAKFCSDECNSRAHKTTKNFRRRKPEGEKRKGTPLVNLSSIGDRDGWRCHLCGKKVDRNLRHPNPLAPSLDHLVPLARGGTNDDANLAVTHLRCNLAKRDRPQGEQLRLI